MKLHILSHTSHILGARSHMWLVATVLDGSDLEHSHHYRKHYWTVLI